MAQLNLDIIDGANHITIIEDDGDRLIPISSPILANEDIFRVFGFKNYIMYPTYKKADLYQDYGWDKELELQRKSYRSRILTTIMGKIKDSSYDIQKVAINYPNFLEKIDDTQLPPLGSAYLLMEKYRSTRNLMGEPSSFDKTEHATQLFDRAVLVNRALYEMTGVGVDNKISTFEQFMTKVSDRYKVVFKSMQDIVVFLDASMANDSPHKFDLPAITKAIFEKVPNTALYNELKTIVNTKICDAITLSEYEDIKSHTNNPNFLNLWLETDLQKLYEPYWFFDLRHRDVLTRLENVTPNTHDSTIEVFNLQDSLMVSYQSILKPDDPLRYPSILYNPDKPIISNILSSTYLFFLYRSTLISSIVILLDLLIAESIVCHSILSGDFVFITDTPQELNFGNSPNTTSINKAGILLNMYAPLCTTNTEIFAGDTFRIDIPGTGWAAKIDGSPDYEQYGWQKIYKLEDITAFTAGDYSTRRKYGDMLGGDYAVKIYPTAQTFDGFLPVAPIDEGQDGIVWNAYRFISNKGAIVIPTFNTPQAQSGEINSVYNDAIQKSTLKTEELTYLAKNLEVINLTITTLLRGDVQIGTGDLKKDLWQSTTEGIVSLYMLANYQTKNTFDYNAGKPTKIDEYMTAILAENKTNNRISKMFPTDTTAGWVKFKISITKLLDQLNRENNIKQTYTKTYIFNDSPHEADSIVSLNVDESINKMRTELHEMTTVITGPAEHIAELHNKEQTLLNLPEYGSHKVLKPGSYNTSLEWSIEYLNKLTKDSIYPPDIFDFLKKVDPSYDITNTKYKILLPIISILTDGNARHCNACLYNAYVKIKKDRNFAAIVDASSFLDITSGQGEKELQTNLGLTTKDLYTATDALEDSSKTARAEQFFGKSTKTISFQIKCIKE